MMQRDLIAELRKLRRERRISQDAIGASIGRHRRTIAAYEVGTDSYNPDVNTLSAWADVLGYEIILQPKAKP